MNIYFSENIKRLRKERNLTQEALADFLGVSFQAVSKWERGESYPDIEMLPVISSFFEITVDELLGIDKSVKEEKIKTYIDKYENMRLNDTTAVLQELKAAIKEFPNEYAILIRYMELLQAHRNHLNAVQDSKEIRSIYERIQKHCTDDELEGFLEALNKYGNDRQLTENITYAFRIMQYLGLRPQKAFAVCSEDIDLRNGLFHVQHSIGSTANSTRQLIGND